MLTKNELANALGLSCVEKYFLAWLNRHVDITNLYSGSFVGIWQVLNDFARGALYQNYCRLPRLQDVAQECGMVGHKFRACDQGTALRLIRATPKDALCLVRVNKSFFTAFKRAAWREDHYIGVNEHLQWLNEYPLGEGVFTEDDFARIYGGSVLVYFLQDITRQTDDLVTGGLIKQEFCKQNIGIDLLAFMSAVGVLRVSRKRWEKFYANNIPVKELFHKENEKLDDLYFSLRLAQIKGNGVESAHETFEECVQIEKQIAEVLQDGKRCRT